MYRYKLTIEYEGGAFSGWQRQQGRPTVQQTLEEAISLLTHECVTFFGAGRTDRGVHARSQVAHMDLSRCWPSDKIRRGLNFYLKKRAVVVIEVQEVDSSFDARFSAKYRRYLYRIMNRPSPCVLEKGRAWWVCPHLDIKAMQIAADLLVGHHDFSNFRAKDCQSSTPFKTLDVLTVTRQQEVIEICAQSRSFLHNQVRSMVGALKYIGEGRWSMEDLHRTLSSEKYRPLTAPPEGLYLTKVGY